jgi:hypothetical protein
MLVNMSNLLKRYKSPHTKDIYHLRLTRLCTNLKMEWCRLCTPGKSSDNNIIHTLGQRGNQRKPTQYHNMTLNHKDWTPPTHTHTNTIRYPFTPQWPSSYNQLDTSLTTIICIHSQDSPPIHYTFAP